MVLAMTIPEPHKKPNNEFDGGGSESLITVPEPLSLDSLSFSFASGSVELLPFAMSISESPKLSVTTSPGPDTSSRMVRDTAG